MDKYTEAYCVLFDLEVAGLRLRDIRSVDPSLWVTNSVPAILVSEFKLTRKECSIRVGNWRTID